jgi:hypothetical protein
MPDPDISSMFIHLHAFRYFSDEHIFETKNLPDWTKEFKFDLTESEKLLLEFLKLNKI